ncbi:MAG: response regulator [Chthoniobacterales bacterium]
MRVLVADDQKGVGTTIAELVRACNHEVVEVVGSGVEAIQAYQRHHPDVVLLDYNMPRLNGATACRNILARDANARVVLVSGGPQQNLTDIGAVAMLTKPVNLEDLNALLTRAAA